MSGKNAVVVLSGGQDSVTCLHWAKQEYERVHAVSFDYGQRHRTELQAAREIAKEAGIPHGVYPIHGLQGGALTDHGIPVNPEGGHQNLPSTFLPGRNLVFLTLAASFGVYVFGEESFDLVTGVCQTDYSGYPDCRRETMDALEKALFLGICDGPKQKLTAEQRADIKAGGPDPRPEIKIVTPLMDLSKAGTVLLARDLNCLEAVGKSVTCYHGKRPGCQKCPACLLRAKGFLEAGISDPATV